MRKFRVYQKVIAFGITAAVFLGATGVIFAAPPAILSYQGRLSDASSNLLGGSNGTTYYFRFAIFSDLAGGTQLWPSGTPATVGLTVQSGVFNALIGDTSAGFDALNLDFHTDPSVYLQVQISANVDFSSSETLTPRQRIVSSGFAINADTVDGAHAGVAANNVMQLGSSAEINLAAFFDIVGTAAPAVSATGEGRIYFDSTTNKFRVSEHGGAYANLVGGSGSSAWDDLTAPDANLSLAMAEYTTTFSWNTAATAAAFDGLTLSLTNDATTDTTVQRGLLIKNESATGGTTERLLVLENADDSTLTTALEILGSSTGAITTGIDVSDAQLTNAFSIGGNFALFDGVRVFEGSTGTLTIEDTSGNDLMTIVDAGSAGNLTATGTINGLTLTAAADGFTIAGGTTSRTLTVTGANKALQGTGTTIDLGGTLTTAAAFTTSGANALTLTTTGATNVTLPTTGTLATLAGSEAFTNKSLNGLTVTSSTGTLTIADGKTFTVNNTITLAGTDSTTMTFPSSSATVAGLGIAQTFSAAQIVSVAGNPLTLTNTTDNASVQTGIIQGDRATMADNDEGYLTLRLSNDAGTQTEFARLTWVGTDVNAATSVDGRLDFAVVTAGTLADEVQLDGTSFSPSTTDGNALGTASLMWGDLFLASEGVINFDNGDVTLTHAANSLSLAGGDFNVAIIDGQSINLDGDGSPTATILVVGDGDTFPAATSSDTMEIILNAAAGNGLDVYRGLVVDVASADHAAATDQVVGIDVEALASADAEGIETAIRVGTGWDIGLDLSGMVLDLDADNDTSITADSDDQIDIEIAGADDFQFTANTFTALSGSAIAISGDDNALSFGAGTDASMRWETADADAHFLSLETTGSNNIIINADTNTDWTHADSTNPTLWVQSADSTDVADYWNVAHNQTNAVQDWGNGSLALAGGNVGVGAVSTSTIPTTLYVLHSNNAAGGIRMQTSETDATNKGARIKVGHYTNAEEPVTIIGMTSAVSSSVLNIGGGSGVENAVTEIDFRTAADNITLTGSVRGSILSGGNWVFGDADAGTTARTGTTLRAPNAATGGAGNIAGADLTIAAGLGTGTGDEGTIIFSLPIVAAAGDNIQTTATRLTLDMAGSSTQLTMTAAQEFIIGTSVGDLLMNIAGGNVAPSADDGAALGISGTEWSDLFLNTGAVINFEAGDVTLTHSADTLALAGGDFTIDQRTTGTSPFRITSIDNATTGPVDLNVQMVSGTIIDVDYSAETLTGDLTGLDLNLNTNVTAASDFDVAGVNVQTPALTAADTAVTTTYTGYNISAAGALDTAATNANAAVVNWRGLSVTMPNIDTGVGSSNHTVTSVGLLIAGGTVTDGGGTEDQIGIDLSGLKLDLDADNDTSITADSDDQIDIEIAGADDFRMTANTFTALAGSAIAIAGDDNTLSFGAGTDASILWETADADAHFLSVETTGSNNIIINADTNTDWTHAASTNPTLWIQSADATTVADYLNLYHDQTNANLDVGAGDLLLNIAGGNMAPDADDGAALGISGTEWSDLFLNTGAVINFEAGDVTITHAANSLSVAGGDFNVAIIDGQSINLDGDGSPTADIVVIGSGDTIASAVDGLDITLTTAEGAGGANLLNLNATFASTTDNSTHNAINIANITATSTTNNMIATGISVGSMTEAGTGTVSSTALFISSGWDNAINVNNSKFTVTPAGITSVNFNSTATTNGVCHSGSDLDAASDTTAALVACNNGAGDYAEWYETEPNVEVGDVVELTENYFTYDSTRVDPFTGLISGENGRETIAILGKAQNPYGAKIFGVISVSPIQTIGSDVQKQGQHPLPVALSGRVPVKVNEENGAVIGGDYLTAASAPGFAMRATRSGRVVGQALESWETGKTTIMMLVQNFYWNGTDQLTVSERADGTIGAAQADLYMNGYAILEVGRIAGISGIWSVSEDGSLQVSSLTVGRPDQPAGITLYDEVSGSPSCVSLRGGAVVVRSGVCGTVSSEVSEISKVSETSLSSETSEISENSEHGTPSPSASTEVSADKQPSPTQRTEADLGAGQAEGEGELEEPSPVEVEGAVEEVAPEATEAATEATVAPEATEATEVTEAVEATETTEAIETPLSITN